MNRRQKRQTFTVAHMTFETKVCPRDGITFALYPTVSLDSAKEKRPKPLFVGFIEKGMAAQLLELSAHIRKLEQEL